MRVDVIHIGKKAKCPACGTISLIEDRSSEQSPIAQVVQPPSAPPAVDRFDSDSNDPFSGTDFNSNANPYRALKTSGRPVVDGPQVQYRPSQNDVQGILAVVLGGVSLLSLMLCACFIPLAMISLAGSIGGLVLSFYAQPPLKTIGIVINSIALGICMLLISLLIGFWIWAANESFNPPTPLQRARPSNVIQNQ